MINNEKTEITIKGKTYKLSEIELITTKDNFLVLYNNNEVKKLPSTSPESDLKQIGVAMYLAEIPNFALWFGGNYIINKSKIVSFTYNKNLVDVDMQTKNYNLTLSNLNVGEIMYIKRAAEENSKEQVK